MPKNDEDPFAQAAGKLGKQAGSATSPLLSITSPENARKFITSLVTAAVKEDGIDEDGEKTRVAVPSFDDDHCTKALDTLLSMTVGADQFGVYTTKVFDDRAWTSPPAVFAAAGHPTDVSGLHDTDTERSLFGFGNAANMPMYRVICASYRDADGNTRSLLHDMIDRGLLYDTLRDISGSAMAERMRDFCLGIAARMGQCDVTTISPLCPTIMWPTDNGDYLYVTPVVNMKVLSAINSKIKHIKDEQIRVAEEKKVFNKQADKMSEEDRAAERERIESESLAASVFIGQTKVPVSGGSPSNAGFPLLDFSASVVLLKSTPPKFSQMATPLKGVMKDFSYLMELRNGRAIALTRSLQDKMVKVIADKVAAFHREKGASMTPDLVFDHVSRIARIAGTELNDRERNLFVTKCRSYVA